MRIESTYTFAAPVDQVFAALTDPDVLRRVIPGCERLIQFGPADAEGSFRTEARLRLGSDRQPYTVTGVVERVRRPSHLALSLRAQGPFGPLTGRGSLDLAEREGHTVAAYVWDIDDRALAPGHQGKLDPEAGAAYAQAVCERLGAVLRAERRDEDETLAEALPLLRADTARGKIIVLPQEPAATVLPERLRPVLTGAAWAGAGLAAGLAALAIAATIIRRWSRGEDIP